MDEDISTAQDLFQLRHLRGVLQIQHPALFATIPHPMAWVLAFWRPL